MTNSKSTKRALLFTVLSLVICISMLIGTTFAWFTDSATANVNKIVSGELDVQIVDADGKEITTPINFVNVEGSADILWEPGASFKTTQFFIKNNGNLALKYTVAINGLVGDSELLEVIDFTVNGYNGEGNLIEAGDISEAMYIVGTMQTTAGNTYMDKTLTGVSIIVNATQYTYEKDMTDDQYDKNAFLPESVDKKYEEGKENVFTGRNISGTVPANADLTTQNGTPVPDGEKITLSAEPANLNTNITVFEGEEAETFEISLVDSNGNKVVSSEDITITLDIGAGRTGAIAVYHNETRIEGVSYNGDTGIVTFTTKNFSPFTVVEKKVLQGGSVYDSVNKVVLHTADEYDIRATLDLGGVVDFGGAVLSSESTDGNYGGNLREYTFKDGTVVKNLTIKGVESTTRWWKANGNVTFENCNFENVEGGLYGIHIGEGDGTVTFKNCKIDGWNTFGSSLTKLVFENCTFTQKATRTRAVCPRSDVDYIGCTFEDNFGVLVANVSGKTYNITMDDCIYNGTELTAENVVNFPYSNYTGIDSDMWTLHNLTVNGTVVK